MDSLTVHFQRTDPDLRDMMINICTFCKQHQTTKSVSSCFGATSREGLAIRVGICSSCSMVLDVWFLFRGQPFPDSSFFPCAWVLAGTIQSIARSTSTKTTNWTTTGTLWRVKVCGMRPRHNFWLLLLAVTWSHHGWTSEVMWLTKIRFFSGHLQKPWNAAWPHFPLRPT